jgi:stage II sporulation protein D
MVIVARVLHSNSCDSGMDPPMLFDRTYSAIAMNAGRLSRMKKSIVVTLIAAAVLSVGGCASPNDAASPPAADPVPMAPPTSARPTAPATPPSSSQTPTNTPIQWHKPKSLGPILPAIVAVPASMSEPTIRVKISAEQSYPPTVRKAYHGRVDVVRLADGKYVAINTLGMEAYLMGVLSREMYGSWGIEAYKAQAIAARTYALYQLRVGTGAAAWDVNSDESSQMYGGVGGETRKSRAAVEATRGQVLETSVRGGTGIFCAFYSACSGGATQDPYEAWGDAPVGPLAGRRVGTIEMGCPKFYWPALTVGKDDIWRCLRAWGVKNQEPYLARIGPIASVAISKRNVTTGRPVEVLVTDNRGTHVPMRAEEFRIALLNDPAGTAPKPPSSFCDFVDDGDAITLTNGRGYGHGIGMSQWGAEALAARGDESGQILSFYYPGSAVRQIW